MPKVLRILNRFNLGGPVLNAAYLSRYLPPSFETLLIGGKHEPYEACALPIVRNMGVEPRIIPHLQRSIQPVQDFRAYQEISRIIDQFEPDIVHTHASKAGAIGRLAAKRKKVPVVVHTFHGHVFHSYFSPLKTRIFIELEKHLSRSTSHIIALSERQKEELSEKYGIAQAEKISVVPLGFELSQFREHHRQKRDAFRKKYAIADDELVVGIVGRLTSIKNHHLFLQAISHALKRSKNKIRAIIIGDGELKDELMSFCQEHQLRYWSAADDHSPNNTVIFTSWIKNIDTAYPGLDIIALTSNNEGTPVSLIEAQAAGIPIVATNVGGVADIVLPGTTALLTKKNSPEDFAEKLLQLIENQDLRDMMGQDGWHYARQKFHFSRLIDDTVKLYEKLL